MNNVVFFIDISGNTGHNEPEYRNIRSRESDRESTVGSQVDMIYTKMIDVEIEMRKKNRWDSWQIYLKK